MRASISPGWWRLSIMAALIAGLSRRKQTRPPTVNASAANPKFASYRGGHGCELRVQKRHWNHRVAGVLFDSEVRSELAAKLANFGIGTPAWRMRGANAVPVQGDGRGR